MKTLHFDIRIAAPVDKVWDMMLSQEGYRQWTTAFFEGSYYEGSWVEGERMHFLAPSGEGMVAVIEELRPHEKVSIQHIGFVKDGVEDLSSEAVTSWAPAYEKYLFAAVDGGTEVSIEQDVGSDHEEFALDAWPKALAMLKQLCEAD